MENQIETRLVDQKYVEYCSDKTLLTSDDGFFHDFVEQVVGNVGQQWINKVFGKLRTDRERLRMIYQHQPASEVVEKVLGRVQEVYRRKNGGVSRDRRYEAFKAYQSGHKLKALSLFSQSVLKAPASGEGLALGFYGRSEVLMTLNEFSYALRDVQMCLKEALPEYLRGDAFWRMAICYKALGELERSKVAAKLAEQLTCDPTKLSIMRGRVSCDYRPNVAVEKTAPPIIGGRSDEFPNASAKIGVKISTDHRGRFMAAKEAIATGETLVVEPPYAACLFPEKSGSHCHECFARLVAPLACPDCCGVAFCGVACRDVALATYHRFECKFLDLLLGSGMSTLAHVALRMMTQCGPQKAAQMYANRHEEAICALCTNSRKRSAIDYLKRTLMAAFFMACLKKAQFFATTHVDDVSPSEEEFQIGELMLFNLQMLQFNAHEICETLYILPFSLKANKVSNIGVGLYPTAALFNHDCYPGVARHFVGKSVVVRTLRPLVAGDAVADNYGPAFTACPLPQRRSGLEARYWFACQCTACLENWPTVNAGLDRAASRVRCPRRHCPYTFTLPVVRPKCPACGHEDDLDGPAAALRRCEADYEAADDLIDQCDTEATIQLLSTAIDSFHRVSTPPHRQTHLAQDKLRTCWSQYGNTHQIDMNQLKKK